MSRYTIICLYEQADEQADEQPNEQPNAQAGELANAHNKLNYTKLFYYLININKAEGEKNFSDENRFIEFSQAKGIIRILRNLNIYVDDLDILEKMNKLKQNLIIQYATIEELYFGPFRVYLNSLTPEVFNVKFLKTCKYLPEDVCMEDKIGYFLVSLQNYFCQEWSGANENRFDSRNY